jgi:hypothetical protein
MSDKISKGGVAKGPVNLHKSLAAGEKLQEATASHLGKGDGAPKNVPSKNVK